MSEKSLSQQIVITDDAAKKIRDLIVEEKNEHLLLRVYIIGGGCSGFQYGFTFVEKLDLDDTVIEKNYHISGQKRIIDVPVRVVIDAMSLQYLIGAEIDYTEGLQGAHFIVRNPNAKTTCGCGYSFSVDE